MICFSSVPLNRRGMRSITVATEVWEWIIRNSHTLEKSKALHRKYQVAVTYIEIAS